MVRYSKVLPSLTGVWTSRMTPSVGTFADRGTLQLNLNNRYHGLSNCCLSQFLSNNKSFSKTRRPSRYFELFKALIIETRMTSACTAVFGKQQIFQADVFSKGIKTDHTSASFVNPFLELQKFVSVPILSETQVLFTPSEAEIAKAAAIFIGSKGSSKHGVHFVGSYVDVEKIPDLDLPQVCFLGRSNVGKSSLIHSLLCTISDVKVKISKKPGHTKTLNLYRVSKYFLLVDMPGYGHMMPDNFQHSVETYLNTSRRLCRTFLLVDGEVGLTSTDHIALDMLKEFSVPFVIVLTKIDKASRHRLLNNVMSLMKFSEDKASHACFSQPFLVSSYTGDGLLLLQTFIAYITGCVQIKGL